MPLNRKDKIVILKPGNILKQLLILPLLICSACQISSHEAEPVKPGRIRCILDTDANNELDDQHAIDYMLFNGDQFEIEGITVNKTRNGGSIDDHYDEAVRTVRLCNAESLVDVYKGAAGEFDTIKQNLHKDDFDGAQAVNFIIKKAMEPRDRELVIFTIGKITNGC